VNYSKKSIFIAEICWICCSISYCCNKFEDAYFGVGFFGILIVRNLDNVIGIEANENAINLAKENAKINDIRNLSFFSGITEKIFDNR